MSLTIAAFSLEAYRLKNIKPPINKEGIEITNKEVNIIPAIECSFLIHNAMLFQIKPCRACQLFKIREGSGDIGNIFDLYGAAA